MKEILVIRKTKIKTERKINLRKTKHPVFLVQKNRLINNSEGVNNNGGYEEEKEEGEIIEQVQHIQTNLKFTNTDPELQVLPVHTELKKENLRI